MLSSLWGWLLNVVASVGLIGFAVYLLRDYLSVFFAKSVEHRLAKELELFRANIRNNETELEQIRSFLTSSRTERNSAIRSRQLEAAEMLLRARHTVGKLSIFVEYMKILNTEKLLDESANPRIVEFIDLLIPSDIDEKLQQLRSIDDAYPKLYLSKESLRAFDAYRDIVLNAAMMMRLFSISLPQKSRFIRSDRLREKIIELVPSSKDGFHQVGDGYAYYLADYFHDEVLRALRREIFGAGDMASDVESAERLSIDCRRAQVNVATSLAHLGLSDDLVRSYAETVGAAGASEKSRE